MTSEAIKRRRKASVSYVRVMPRIVIIFLLAAVLLKVAVMS